MVRDINNMPEARIALDEALDDGMEDLYDDTLETLLKNWSRGSDALGNSWESLSPTTIERKGHGAILVDSGDLRDNVKQKSEYRTKDKTFILTSSLPYAGAHEFGLPEQGIPARPFLGPAAQYAVGQIEDQVGEKIDDYLEAVEVR